MQISLTIAHVPAIIVDVIVVLYAVIMETTLWSRQRDLTLVKPNDARGQQNVSYNWYSRPSVSCAILG